MSDVCVGHYKEEIYVLYRTHFTSYKPCNCLQKSDIFKHVKMIENPFTDFFKAWKNKETVANVGYKVGDLHRKFFQKDKIRNPCKITTRFYKESNIAPYESGVFAVNGLGVFFLIIDVNHLLFFCNVFLSLMSACAKSFFNFIKFTGVNGKRDRMRLVAFSPTPPLESAIQTFLIITLLLYFSLKLANYQY